MPSQAEVIKDLIELNWSLTCELSKTGDSAMKEIVRFFDRKQVQGNEWPKAITVEKINAEADENRKVHPHFTEVRDMYKITCHFRVTDVNPDTYSDALLDVEDMGKEVQVILDTAYDPSSGLGRVYVVDTCWSKTDHLDGAQPEV